MIHFDGHVHTPFCPHGTPDSIPQYIEAAIEMGIKGLSFTEHAPLPNGFCDPTPDQDSAMSAENLPKYLEELRFLKNYYKNAIAINIGLEVDFIKGWEQETKAFLNEIG